MVLVNYTTRELTAKLVYYGPGLCGKTTNLQYIYESLLPPDRRGKMVSLATETDRTLFFDFLPLEIGTIRGLKTRLQLYTVPGQVHYNATRKIVLKGADGIVFVADSQRSMKQANRESFQNMRDNLQEHGLDLAEIPHVLQFNKRDLPDVMPVEELFEDLNEFNMPFWEAVAVEGVGVEDTLKSVVKLVLKNLAMKFAPDSAEATEAVPGQAPSAPAAAPAPAAAAPVPEPARPAPAPAAPAEPVPAAAASAGKPQLMTSTGELLALEFGGGGGEGGDEEVLEVDDDALLLDEGGSAGAAPSAPAAAAQDNPFGDEPIEPGAAVADDAADALDGLDLDAAGGGTADTLFMGGEEAPADLEMPSLEGGDEAGDTVLSPIGDLDGLATAADLPGASAEAPDLGAGLDLTDIPDLPDVELPKRPSPPAAAPPVAAPAAVQEAAPPTAPPAAAEVLDVPTTIQLGRVDGTVERTLKLPIEWTDASGQTKKRSLEVQLRFSLD